MRLQVQNSPIKVRLDWKVRCVNRATKEFSDKYLVLDWNRCPDDKKARILTTLERMRWHELIPMREYFVELTEGEAAAQVSKSDFEQYHCAFVPGYFEDENGASCDEVDLASILSGDPFPILAGNVLSVLRLGPSSMVRPEQWTPGSANCLVHFLQVAKRLQSSRWLRSKVSISWTADSSGERQILRYEGPDEDLIHSMLLPVRLLTSSDDVFRKACKKYCQHVADERKRWWVNERRASFNQFVRLPPAASFARVGELAVYEIIDLVFYGTGYVHGNPAPEKVTALRGVLTEFGREQLMIAFNASCQEIASYAINVAPLFHMELSNWIKTEGIDDSDLIDTSLLY